MFVQHFVSSDGVKEQKNHQKNIKNAFKDSSKDIHYQRKVIGYIFGMQVVRLIIFGIRMMTLFHGYHQSIQNLLLENQHRL